jgi:hypothetical protein
MSTKHPKSTNDNARRGKARLTVYLDIDLVDDAANLAAEHLGQHLVEAITDSEIISAPDAFAAITNVEVASCAVSRRDGGGSNDSGTESTSRATPVVLIIRDPDSPNDVGLFGIEARVIDVDLGSSFDGRKGFDAEDKACAEWARSTLGAIAELSTEHPARKRVASLLAEMGWPSEESEDDVARDITYCSACGRRIRLAEEQTVQARWLGHARNPLCLRWGCAPDTTSEERSQ